MKIARGGCRSSARSDETEQTPALRAPLLIPANLSGAMTPDLTATEHCCVEARGAAERRTRTAASAGARGAFGDTLGCVEPNTGTESTSAPHTTAGRRICARRSGATSSVGDASGGCRSRGPGARIGACARTRPRRTIGPRCSSTTAATCLKRPMSGLFRRSSAAVALRQTEQPVDCELRPLLPGERSGRGRVELAHAAASHMAGSCRCTSSWQGGRAAPLRGVS
jgi:hypothetical protein